MNFGILGQLEVRTASGDVVEVRGSRRRALVAHLLLHRGQAVPIDRICDDVWDGEPSPGARATVTTYISQLRRLLADHGGPPLRSEGAGYRLDLPDDALDAARFERLLSGASVERSAGERLRLVERALALWRGPALAEFAHTAWARPAAVGLDEARLRAQLVHAEALVELGRPGDALPELERLVAAHPLDEGVAATLARARYHAGNHAGGLRALAQIRQRLADELGAVPGARIGELESQILRHEVATAPGGASASASVSALRASSLPTGVVTFLFTDVVDSTRLVESLGSSRYGAVLTELRAALREVWARHDGVEFGTEGDAQFVAFARASDAVAGAADAQRAIASRAWPGEPPRVRIGVHTGEAEVHDGDYVGLALHIGARVCAAASGGQVLLTDSTAKIAATANTRDLGVHRLRGVGTPVGLLQLLGEGLPDGFPPPRTLSAHPNNLPLVDDELIGRGAELEAGARALDDHRLVTFTGVGGAGKTRLALELAAAQVHRYPDGVWFVELAREHGDDRVAPAVADLVGIAAPPGTAVVGSLVGWFAARRLLVVLDNCEHVLDGAADLAAAILRACPHVHLLATSREPLGVRGEQVVPIAPLAVGEAAAELFTIRARASSPGAELEAHLVRRVCERLDGLPLAIELAAARLRGLSLRDLAERLDDRFRLLVAGPRGDVEHHRTLESVVAWSYDLLGASDRRVFERCAVFSDAFDLGAAAHVASGGDMADADVVDALGRLVDKSLVVHVTGTSGRTRYRLLETLRQYGRERLLEAGDLDHRRDRLVSWAMEGVARLEREMRTPRQDLALRLVLPDRANLRAAFDRAVEQRDHLTALRIVSAVPIGLPSERRDLITRLIPLVGAEHERHVAQANLTLTNLSLDQGDWTAALAAGRAATDGFVAVGDERLASWGRYFQCFAAWGLGDLDETDQLLAQLVDDFRRLGDEFGLAYALWSASQRAPDLARADALAAEAEGLLRALGAPFALAHDLEGRALIGVQAGRRDRARDQLLEALLILSDAGNTGCTAHCLEAVGVLLAEEGRELTAVAELVGAADALRTAGQHHRRPWEIRAHHAVLAELAGTADQAPVEQARARGREHDLSSAVRRAETLLAELART